MAEYKVVNTEQLNTDLTSVADAIREKSGTKNELIFPDGFVTAVEGIESGGGIDDTISQFLVYEFSTDLLVLSCDYVRSYAFWNMVNISKLDCPNATTIRFNAFDTASGLTSIRFKNVTEIQSSAFFQCETLEKFIIETPIVGEITDETLAPCSLVDTSAFSSTPIESYVGAIYVPQEYLNVYINDTNWGIYQILSIEDNLDLLSEDFPDLLETYGGSDI